MKAFILVLALILSVKAQPCEDYECDTMVVRAILDSNGLHDTPLSALFIGTDSSGTSGVRVISLNFYAVQIGVLPEDLGRLSELKILHWDCCVNSLLPRIEELPEAVGDLTHLEELVIRHTNSLATLPVSIGNLASLEMLDLEGNQLETLPSSIGGLSSLVGLHLSSNNLSSLPDSIMSLECPVDLGHNTLCFLPADVASWADAHDPDWRETQDCTPVRGPWPLNGTAKGLRAETPVMFYTVRGRFVATMPFSQVREYLNQIPEGTYLVVEAAGGNHVQKIVVGR